MQMLSLAAICQEALFGDTGCVRRLTLQHGVVAVTERAGTRRLDHADLGLVGLRGQVNGVFADAACFEARFNLGLVALQTGKLREALTAYEYALALRPDSTDARLNFALALKQANYPFDAAMELQRILRTQPRIAKAHLFLANLYAQQLDQPAAIGLDRRHQPIFAQRRKSR